MIVITAFDKMLDRAFKTLIFSGMMAAAGAIFYLIPPDYITALYSIASVAGCLLIVCMLQSHMTDSSIWFRIAMCGLAAGCLASGITPFIYGYSLGPWALLKALALLAVIAMMRWRQIKPTR